MTYIPRHAITFMVSSGHLALRYGLKQGALRAAAKVSPPLMVFEAVVSVATAINSYIKLRQAQEYREFLTQFIPLEEKRLEVEREQLRQQLENAQRAIQKQARINEQIGKLVLACSTAYRAVWTELLEIRESDLPDIQRFDKVLHELEGSWSQVRRSLEYFQHCSS